MRSIRTILFSWFSVILVGLLLVTGGVLYSVTQRLLTQFFVEDNSQALGFIVQNVRAHYASNLRALDRLGSLSGLRPLNLGSAKNQIQHFLENDNLFGRVELYAIDGRLLIEEFRETTHSFQVKRNLFNEWDRRFVATAKQVIETGKPTTTGTFRHSNGLIHQSYMVPVMDIQHRVTALLIGAVYYNAKQFNHFMEGLKLGDQNFLMLTDIEGNLLAQDGLEADQAEGSPRSLSLQPQIQQASEAFYQGGHRRSDEIWIDKASFKNRENYTLLALPIESFKLILTLGASEQAVIHKETSLLNWMFATLAVVLILSFLASGYISALLSKPFLLLIKAHDRLHRGDLSVRVHYDKNDEIGVLCDSFNRLSKKIDKARLLGHLWGKDSESSSNRQT